MFICTNAAVKPPPRVFRSPHPFSNATFQLITALLCAADVLTIENSRSGDAMLTALATAGYSKDLGPGVYDVHSPSVPPVAALVEKLRAFVATGILGGDARRIWVNPDCGLKTRGWPEVVSSLRNMVEAARVLRAEAA
jgi:5-methyltetrahydropteroyltriglutamate--homocysteine methyltransferase